MFLLGLIALLEGFTTLAVEIIALRMAVPVVGSSIVLTSIYLGVILLALSTGYYLGGVVASKTKKKHIPLILFVYLLFSGLYYFFLTFALHKWLLETVLQSSGSYIVTLFIVSIALFFIPVCIASQTIPLLTELVPDSSKGRSAGAILFFSTVGSFLGSVGTTIVLFEYFGVVTSSHIVSFVMLTTAVLSLYLYKKNWGIIGLIFVGVIIAAISLQPKNIGPYTFLHDSPYQQIAVAEVSDGSRTLRVFHTNGSYASGIYTDTQQSPFGYIKEAIALTKRLRPKKVLVIGTAGFTYPNSISQLPYVEQIDAVDIDPAVKNIAEQHFLQKELSPKITFIPESARYFVDQAQKGGVRYDLIFVDAFEGRHIPDELLTQEFFGSLRSLSDPSNIMFNLILDKTGNSTLSQSITSTMQSVFGEVYGKDVSTKKEGTIGNILVVAKRYDKNYLTRKANQTIYTDDKRSTDKDLVQLRSMNK